MIRIQTRVYQGLELLSFFTMRIWDFKSTNYASLQDSLSEDDKKEWVYKHAFILNFNHGKIIFHQRNSFNMYTDDIDVNEYLKTVILGGRQYCLKEPLSSIPKARMQLKAWVLTRHFSFIPLKLLSLQFVRSWSCYQICLTLCVRMAAHASFGMGRTNQGMVA